MIFQELSLMYTVGHSENLKIFPKKDKAMGFSGFDLQG